jgi:hypothetical protein
MNHDLIRRSNRMILIPVITPGIITNRKYPRILTQPTAHKGNKERPSNPLDLKSGHHASSSRILQSKGVGEGGGVRDKGRIDPTEYYIYSIPLLLWRLSHCQPCLIAQTHSLDAKSLNPSKLPMSAQVKPNLVMRWDYSEEPYTDLRSFRIFVGAVCLYKVSLPFFFIVDLSRSLFADHQDHSSEQKQVPSRYTSIALSVASTRRPVVSKALARLNG